MSDLRHELQVLLAANSRWFPKKWGTEPPSERDGKIGMLADKIADFLERVYEMTHRPPAEANEVSKYDGETECPLDQAVAVLAPKPKRPTRFVLRRAPSR